VNRILVIQTAFLGDVILATPVVSELKRLFPDSQIDMLVKKGNESLLKNSPHITNILVFDKSNGKFQSLFRLVRKVRKQHYDLVINLHRFGSSGVITALSGSKSKYGFRKNPFSFLFTKAFPHEIGNGTHEVERNLSLIREFGAVDCKRPELFTSTENDNKIQPWITESYFCCAPASVWMTKQLPIEKWVELINQLKSKGQVYLIGGKDDYNLCDSIADQTGISKEYNLCGQLNLLDSAALMKSAAMNYVNDSGPMHIASAVNAPVSAFFCSTIPEFGFVPLSDHSHVVQIDKKIDCRPCGFHGHKVCPKGTFECGKEIKISI
jgi:lipopolysaccharide heptosyltransferase II